MSWGRAYFAVQAVAGAVWWIAVFTIPWVRTATLGSLDPVAVAALDVPLFVGGSALAAAGLRWAGTLATAWTLLVLVLLAGFATATGEAGWGVLLMAGAAGASVLALCLLRLGRIPTEWLLIGPFAFRPAAPRAGSRVHVLFTALQIVVFWGILLVVVPLAIDGLEHRWGLSAAFPPGAVPFGGAILIAASALGIWAGYAMSTRGGGTPLPAAMPRRFVTAGPYRFVRNPMAIAGVLQAVAVGLLLSSWLVVVYAVAGSLVWNFAVRPNEEADLVVRFGEPYERYRREVRCWWPTFRVAPSDRPAGA